jgi:hypothetical protein
MDPPKTLPYFNNLGATLAEEIQSAVHSLILVGEGISDPGFQAVLAEREAAGVHIVLLECGPTSERSLLVKKGFGCKQFIENGAGHSVVFPAWTAPVDEGKLVLIDQRKIVLGRFAWKSGASVAHKDLFLVEFDKAHRDSMEVLLAKAGNSSLSAADSRVQAADSQSTRLVAYPESSGFSLAQKEKELRTLQLRSYLDYHVEIEGVLSRFQQRKLRCLGAVVERFLKIKRDQFRPGTPGDDPKRYHRLGREYQDYAESLDQAVSETAPCVLSAESQEELKGLYKKGSLLCHPDRVGEELQSRATALFQELSAAYRAGDIDQLRQIVQTITTEGLGGGDIGESLSEDDHMDMLHRLRKAACTKADEVRGILLSDDWRVLEEYDDWDVYFIDQERRLHEEIDRMTAASI